MPNSKNTEPVRRRVLILKYLGESRHPLTASEIRARLAAEHVPIHVTLRTIQRDLEMLEDDFKLRVDHSRKPHTWSYPRKQRLELPAPREEEAAARLIASDALAGRMPGWVLDLLEPMLGSARRALEESGLGDWRSRFKVIGRGPRLMPPDVDPEVFRTAIRALSESRRLEADYRARGADGWKRYDINPLGLVVADGVFYLVATLWDYDDVRQLALHRMRKAALLDRRATTPEGFDLGRYIEEEKAFSYPVSDRKIRLVARFHPDAAFHLRERRLADDQRLTEEPDGWCRLEATVPDTMDLRWWLLAFGDNVEVLLPPNLRTDIASRLRAAMSRYHS